LHRSAPLITPPATSYTRIPALRSPHLGFKRRASKPPTERLDYLIRPESKAMKMCRIAAV
jgi:hypothetical protein